MALVHLLLTKPNKGAALYQAFSRHSSPNLSNLLATVFVFFLVIYLQGFKVEVKLVHKKYAGVSTTFPIKLFYTSNISVIFQSALVSNLYFFSQILYRRFKGTFWIGLVGNWQEIEGGSIPVSGLAYWISPPRDFLTFISEPLHSLVYTLFVMLSCAFFSRYPIPSLRFWLEVSKESPRDIAKKFKDEGMRISGFRDSTNT